MNLPLPDFDIEKIARSGQCFRLNQREPGRFLLIAGGKKAELIQGPAGYTLACAPGEEPFYREYFDAKTDYRAMEKAISPADGFLQAAAQYGRGIRILKQEPFETLITFIVSQQNNIPKIRRSVEALCALAGERIGEEAYAFPTPEALYSLTAEELKGCLLGYRCKYVHGAAEKALREPKLLKEMEALPDRELREALLGFFGVGEKVASCVSLFAYHRLDAFPVDVWIRRTLEEAYGGAFDPSPYAGFAGVLQQYMFFFAREGEYGRWKARDAVR